MTLIAISNHANMIDYRRNFVKENTLIVLTSQILYLNFQ
jgi:hypothetical protein